MSRDIKKHIFLGVLFLISFSFVKAQDLEDYQKLRGDIISSTPWPTEQTNTPVYYHAYNAFDTNESTAFKSADAGGWIGLDLKTPCPIRKVRIYPRADKRERVRGTIQGASDPNFTNPTDLYTIATNPRPSDYTTYDISSDESFRYVRLKTVDEYECNLMEIEFYTDLNTQAVEYSRLTNLPTIYIETKGQFDFVNKEEYKTSTIVVADEKGVNSYPGGIRGRGNSTWEYMEKKSFRIKFDKKQQFLGLPANAKSWTLLSNYTDKTFIRNGLAFEMSKEMGFEWTPSCVYADVVLDGFYYGTFAVCDQVQIHEDRIDIDEMTPADTGFPTITGGYHLEIDAYAYQEPYFFYTNRGIPFAIKNPDDPCMLLQYYYIKDHIQNLEDMLYSDPETACKELIDLESAVKYYLHSELTGNCDSYWCIPCYKKRNDDKLYFGPVWDYDQAFLNNERVPLYYPTLDTQHGSAQPWFRIIMETKEAKNILKKEWQKLKDRDLQQKLYDYVDYYEELLNQTQDLNYKRWDCLNRHVWFDDFQYNTFEKYMERLKWFIDERFGWYEEYIGDIAGDYYYFLPASKPMNEKKEWRYMTRDTDYDWYAEDFDDWYWSSGFAPFGDRDNYQNTLWRSGTILIRTEFHVDEDIYDRINKLYLNVFHDEDCWIYINGKEVLRLYDYNHNWDNFQIDKQAIRPGNNLIAIKCVQTAGGQLIDTGVFASLTDNTRMDEIQTDYKYRIINNILTIDNAIPETDIYLYSIEGKLIRQVKTSGSKVEIRLPNKGIYLVKLQDKTLKVVGT